MNLGLYIQVPFCRTKCTYCNFNTGVFSKSLYSRYVDSVVREILEHRAMHAAAGLSSSVPPCASSMVVDTVYIGGGTPSLLEPSDLARMLDAVRATFACAFQEVTLEADPETVTREKVAAWLDTGINRVSLGTQSFNDRELAAAGRLHRRADIYRSAETLRSAGLDNFSFDLIAGLPHQTPATWGDSLKAVLELAPEHVSVYMLEIDEGSRLGRESLAGGNRYSAPAIPDDDCIAASYEEACSKLEAAEYEHYEISNWAQPGKRSTHNLKYWMRTPYFGFGAGAHSFDGVHRWANAHDPAAYTESVVAGRLPLEQRETLTADQHLDEELFLGLRLLKGINVSDLESRYNVSLRSRLEKLAVDGFVDLQGDRARLAPARLSVSNEVFIELMQ